MIIDAFISISLLAVAISGYMFKRSADRLIHVLEEQIEILSSRVADLTTDEGERRAATTMFQLVRKKRLNRQ